MTDVSVAETSEERVSTGRNVENFYLDKSGARHKSPPKDVAGIVKRFKDGGDEIRLDLSELEESVILQAAAFGLHQVGQNAYGASKDTDDKITLCEARFDTLKGGDWASDRQSGPGTNILLEAFKRAYEEGKGREPSEDWVAEKREALKDENTAKEAQKRPLIKKHIEAIKAERQVARAAKAAESAGDDSLDFLD